MGNGVQNIQATAYNGAPHTVYRMAREESHISSKYLIHKWILAFHVKKKSILGAVFDLPATQHSQSFPIWEAFKFIGSATYLASIILIFVN